MSADVVARGMAAAAQAGLKPTSVNLSATPNGSPRIASYTDLTQRVFGVESLWQWYHSWRTTPNQTPVVMLSGDSTMLGAGCSTSYKPAAILPILAQAAGFLITTALSAYSGETSAQWLATRLPADLLGAVPAVYVIRWGMNDPYYGIAPAQTIANLRAGMALLRATWDYTQTGMVLMMPNTASDDANGRNEAWRETVRPGMAQAARDFGACFIDNYDKLRTARTTVPIDGNWLDAARVHPNDDHEMLYSESLAKALFPQSLQVMKGVPVAATANISGWTQSGEPASTYMVGPTVFGTGFFQASGATAPTNTKVATLPVQHAPSQAFWYAPLLCWNGSAAMTASNWFTLRCLIATNGEITTQEASSQVVSRCYFDNLSWKR